MDSISKANEAYINKAMAPAPSKTMGQAVRFIVVGVFNTAVDFSILNLVSMLTGVERGATVGFINIPGFLVALMSSYFLNKYWTFKAAGEGTSSIEFGRFAAVSVVGLAINSGALILITSNFGVLAEAVPFLSAIAENERLTLNLAKVIATGFSLVWNFIGYKFLVFRPKTAGAA